MRDPFFSPDGQWIAFYNAQGLMKIPVGAVRRDRSQTELLPWRQLAGDGRTVYSTADVGTGLMRVSDTGGVPTPLTRPDKGRGEADHVLPSVLPDGRGILFTILDAAANAQRVAVFDLRDQSQKYSSTVPRTRTTSTPATSCMSRREPSTRSIRPRSTDGEGEPVTLASDVLVGTALGVYYAVSRLARSPTFRRPLRRMPLGRSTGSIARR